MQYFMKKVQNKSKKSSNFVMFSELFLICYFRFAKVIFNRVPWKLAF